MGLASKMALAYGVQQGAQVMQQLAQNKPSPYPPAQGQGNFGGPPQGHAAGYYNQGQPQQQHPPQGPGYGQSYGAPPSNGYNPAYAAAGGAMAGAAMGAAYMHGGQPQQHAPSHGGPTSDPNYILNLTRQTVQDQNLHAFYPQGSLEPLAHRISQSGALQRISQEWRLPMEVAFDLAKLALFDTILYLDDSGSMAFEENGSRIDDAKLITSRVATAASLFDTDGIQVVFMNGRTMGSNITSEQQAAQLLGGVNFSGLTPFGTALDQKILQPLVVGPARANALRKPVLVIGVTDGEPAGEDRRALVNAVKNAKAALQQTRYGPDAISLEIAQVGNDQKARHFLEELDSDPNVGSLIDVTGTYENEQDNMLKQTGMSLSPDLWLCKLMLGAIDSSYDHKDERRY
ncbi:hypothetical protein JCM11251_001730 [Rhodosporidiobolus azoricus]